MKARYHEPNRTNSENRLGERDDRNVVSERAPLPPRMNSDPLSSASLSLSAGQYRAADDNTKIRKRQLTGLRTEEVDAVGSSQNLGR
jgi:hypothetical protein